MLKICDIKNIQELKALHRKQIDFVGFHLITENDFKRSQVIHNCIEYLHSVKSNTKAILVTKETEYEKIKELINEYEFDGIQLHYQDSKSNIHKIRAEYGDNFIIVQVKVVEAEDLTIDLRANYLLLDSSFTGGTGNVSKEDYLNEAILRIEIDKTFIAGGINTENILDYIKIGYKNFDIQSGVKNTIKSQTENIDYRKIDILTKLLSYKERIYPRIGTSIKFKEDITAFLDYIDFFHIDLSDGFVGEKTDLDACKEMINYIHKTNSNINIQIHIFAYTSESANEMVNFIGIDLKDYPVEIFLHINSDNYLEINENPYYPAFDVSDILKDTIPIDKYFKEKVLLCMQNENNPERIENLNSAIKYISVNAESIDSVYIDRGVDSGVIEGLESTNGISAIMGKYLKEYGQSKYKLIKDILYAKQ